VSSRKKSRKGKGGPKPGQRWTPQTRAFVEHMKSGKVTQTEACRLAFPKCKSPSVLASQLIRKPLIVEALAGYERLRKLENEEAAKTEGQELGKQRAVTKGMVRARLWELASLSPLITNGTITGQVRASMGLAEVLGMKIGAQDPDKFEGFTEQELEQYYKDGTVPERYAVRFGIAPGGPSTIM